MAVPLQNCTVYMHTNVYTRTCIWLCQCMIVQCIYYQCIYTSVCGCASARLYSIYTYQCIYKSVYGRGGVVNGQSQNQGSSPPKPDTWDRYKVFCLKDHILSAKKNFLHHHITF